MALDPTMAKQIKADTATTLRLEHVAYEPRDWTAINNYLRTTKVLREVDASTAWAGLDEMAPGLESNRTLFRLSLGNTLQEYNLPVLIGILKANTGIAELNLSSCYQLDKTTGALLVQHLKENQTITHLDMAFPNTPDLKVLVNNAVKALENSPNILHFSPNTDGKLGDTCVANREAAARLLQAATGNCENLSVAELQDIKVRLPSIIHKAENDEKLGVARIAKMLVNLEDAMDAHGLAFSIPARYVDTANGLPRPFHPSADKVVFSTAGALTAATAYQAAEAGQVGDLLALLKNGQWKISAEDCLFKPDGKKESMIELVARQGKLADIMAVAHWVGDARGFKLAADAVPAREWDRQMKDNPLDKLLSQVNAASFKKAHRPQMRFG